MQVKLPYPLIDDVIYILKRLTLTCSGTEVTKKLQKDAHGSDGSLTEEEADTSSECIEMSALTRAVSRISERISKLCKTVA